MFRTDRWDAREAVRAAANRELSADLQETARDRLQRLSAVATITLSAYATVAQLLSSSGGAPGGLLWAGAAISALLYALARHSRARPHVVLEAGTLYLVVLCLLLGFWRHSGPFPADAGLRQVSPVVVPILAFGALIPSPPKRSFVLSLAAAAMDPLSLYLLKTRTGPIPLQQALLLGLSPFVAAGFAYGLSRATHRLSEGIVEALKVGSYRLVERLGAGKMAEVWRAAHQMLARPAAVKLIRPSALVSHGQLEAERLLTLFAREAQTTASLCSPHTVHIYDFGITREGSFYYVMELLDGIDLQTLVEQFGPQPPERVAHVLKQACHSLHEAHQRDFVHRDVKPANIFACHYGQDFDFVKVLDFGLVLDRHPTLEEIEDEQRFVGTPAIMAPEMVRFQAKVDARADIYALGCVGYWLLTGKRVFEATKRHDMLVMHAHQRPLSPSRRLGVEVHPGIEAVVMSCLEKNPNRRPQSARELSESLSALSFEHEWSEERARLWWQSRRAGSQPSG